MLRCDGSEQEAEEILSALPLVTSASFEPQQGAPVTVRVRTDSPDIHALSRELFFAFAARNIALLELSPKKGTLEDVFLELAEGRDASLAGNAQAPSGEEESEAISE